MQLDSQKGSNKIYKLIAFKLFLSKELIKALGIPNIKLLLKKSILILLILIKQKFFMKIIEFCIHHKSNSNYFKFLYLCF